MGGVESMDEMLHTSVFPQPANLQPICRHNAALGHIAFTHQNQTHATLRNRSFTAPQGKPPQSSAFQ